MSEFKLGNHKKEAVEKYTQSQAHAQVGYNLFFFTSSFWVSFFGLSNLLFFFSFHVGGHSYEITTETPRSSQSFSVLCRSFLLFLLFLSYTIFLQLLKSFLTSSHSSDLLRHGCSSCFVMSSSPPTERQENER
jgi:hypothetical protein